MYNLLCYRCVEKKFDFQIFNAINYTFVFSDKSQESRVRLGEL